MQVVNVSEAKSRFSELLSRATAGERFLIRRRERSLAVLINADELQLLERQAEASARLAAALGQDAELLAAIEAEAVHPAMAAFGLWKDEANLDNLIETIYENRDTQGARGGRRAMKILDSDHCIAILRGKLDLRSTVDPREILGVTTINIGELVHGAHKSARAPENLASLDILLSHLVVLSFDENAARRFGEIKTLLEQAGTLIADLDLQIASVTIAHQGILVTHNRRHFARVPGIEIEDWIE